MTALSAIVALALGIGFSTTMFSIVRGGTRGLPFEDGDAIVAVQRIAVRPGVAPATTVGDYQRWAGASRRFDALGAFQTSSINLSGDGHAPQRVSAAAVTAGTFGLLRVAPARGRALVEADAAAGAPLVAMISDELWRGRYQGDPDILGRSIRADGETHTVIGVMPSGFRFPLNASIWTALPNAGAGALDRGVQVFGRLAPGQTRAAAAAELQTLARAAAVTDDARDGLVTDVIDFVELETPREVRTGLYLLLLAVSGVLFIACANVANLFVVRAVVRARDLAVRLALGAERRTVVIEQIAESLVLSAIAAAAGLAIAWAGTRAFRLATAHILDAFWMDFRIDAAIVLYASGLAIVAAVAAAAVPALRASRADVAATLRDAAHGSSSLRIGRLGRGLLSGQTAFACALLAFTLLLGRAAVGLHSRPWPFDPDAVLTAQISVPAAMLDDQDARSRLLRQLEDQLTTLPGARAAALTSALPGRGSGDWTFSLDGPVTSPAGLPTTGVAMVSPEYFAALGARVLRGRGLTAQDAAAAPVVAVVNERFAARFFADRDPIGHQVYLGSREMTIVGIVSDLLPRDIDEHAQDGIYLSIHQMRPYAIRIIVSGPGDPLTLVEPLRTALQRVDPDLALVEPFTAREAAMREKRVLDVLSGLFGLFGAGALLLTAMGLYSVTAFSVSQRRREFAIRAALGATRRDLARLVARQGGRQLAIGLTTGILLAFVLIRGFTASVAFAAGADHVVLGGVALSMLVASALAMIGPVQKAAGTDPVRALRE